VDKTLHLGPMALAAALLDAGANGDAEVDREGEATPERTGYEPGPGPG
jgi:hypothetical protein